MQRRQTYLGQFVDSLIRVIVRSRPLIELRERIFDSNFWWVRWILRWDRIDIFGTIERALKEL